MINIKDFERIKFDGDNKSHGYFKTEKLSNGQTIAIYLFRYECKSNDEYSVFVAIANKKKHIKQLIDGQRDILSDKEVGRCGLEGLLWAKRQLLDFEDSEFCRNDDVIIIHWTDNRRRNVYEYGLKKYGYIIGNRYGSKCLSKKIIK